MQKVNENEIDIEISEEDWKQYVMDSPLYIELLEDDPEQLMLILDSLDSLD